MNDTSLGLGGGMWMFGLILLFLVFGGGSFGFGGNGNTEAVQADINRGFDNQNLQAQTRDILSAVTGGTAQSVAATNQSFHDILGAVSDKYSELARDIAAVAVAQQQSIANQNECCCGTKMLISETGAGINANIAQNRYEAAMNTAAINANTTAQTQKILDEMKQNKIESLQQQVNQLQLAQATSGMLKFPNSWSYGAGPFPPIFGCPNAV
jgi:hypothetical protein